MLRQLRNDPARTGAQFGLLGAAILVLALFAAALAYTGTGGERYSPVNHWVSELGEVGVSELAAVFNIGLIVGGACFAVCMLALALPMHGAMRWAFGGAGLVAGVSGLLVGVFPMNMLEIHAAVASVFFNAGGITVALFTLYVLFDAEAVYPRALAIPGVAAAAAFAIFLVHVAFQMRDPAFSFAAPAPDARLDFWPVATLEWLVVVLVLLWLAVVSLRLRRQSK